MQFWVKISCFFNLKIFSFKKRGFQVEVPFFVSNLENLHSLSEDQKKWIFPLLIGSTITSCLIFRYFTIKRNKQRETKNLKQMVDKKSKREIEIKLIQKRAAESYQNECKVHGLVIVEAYYGKKEIIEELLLIQDKLSYLELNPEKKQKIIDVTIPLRFQVYDSNLALYGKTKKHLFGFYNPSKANEENSLLIK